MKAEPYPQLPDDKLKDAYEMTCAHCGHDQMVQPSMMMTVFGLNTGHGSCLECKTFLHLYITADNSKIISEKWDDHLNRMKGLGIIK